MNKEIKIKWLEALRSGDYKQGKGVLRIGGYFCCLGVLCDIVDNSKWDKNWEKSETYNGSFASLPPSVEKIAGLRRGEKVFGEHSYTYLVKLNDELNYDFNQIADEIEKHL